MKPAIVIAATLSILSGVAVGQTPPAAPQRQTATFFPPTREFLSEAEPAERAEAGSEGREDEIETDRDSFTPSVRTVGRKRFVFESAYTFFDNRGRAESHSFPESLARYGLTERVELRLGWNYEVGGAAGTEPPLGAVVEPTLERESVLNVGVKASINEQRSWIPESSLILAALVPTSGEETATQFVGTYVFGWELPSRWKLDAALRLGSAEEEGDHFADWAPSVVVKAPIGEKVNVHAEYFGILTQGKEKEDVLHYFSPGVHYLITRDLEVGIRLGWGLNDQAARFFTNVGFGIRF